MPLGTPPDGVMVMKICLMRKYKRGSTAIYMRIILSEGGVNIFNLAKSVGTSVEQIERFCARNLPLSAEMARNLQSFGGGG